jgi:hypothetical protein
MPTSRTSRTSRGAPGLRGGPVEAQHGELALTVHAGDDIVVPGEQLPGSVLQRPPRRDQFVVAASGHPQRTDERHLLPLPAPQGETERGARRRNRGEKCNQLVQRGSRAAELGPPRI